MGKKRIVAPADGDRIDLGGKVPQFSAFAHYIYQHLLKRDFAWAKIGDVKADKLDDILFATNSEIHAFQMKWSNQQKTPSFSFKNFRALLLEMIPGWRKLKIIHAADAKVLHVYMITNRQASTKDKILDRKGAGVGSFDDFMQQAFWPIKAGQKLSVKWLEILAMLKDETGLSKSDFFDFFDDLSIILNFKIPENAGHKVEDVKKRDDFSKLREFIINEIADKKKKIEYDLDALINALGWQHRFKTTFNHEFIVDKTRYQPIASTIDNLNGKVDNFTSGYLFLSGTPGAGKSTLLTQWSKESEHIIVRYYAFSNVSISQNFNDRGEAEKLYFDLVVQLNELGYTNSQTVLPHHNEVYLREVFFKQLDDLSDHYAKTGEKTLIIIDGLDHIPREYHTTKSLLGSLPPPNSIPDGVILILGSQSFEIEGLELNVKASFREGNRNISMQALDFRAVKSYLQNHQPPLELDEVQEEKIYQLSKGHPLQLNYLAEELTAYPEKIGSLLEREGAYDNIEDYYEKIWHGLDGNTDLHDTLALIARIRGEISLLFINEWTLSANTINALKAKAFHLFSRSGNALVFFHNSFRQFIINKTSVNNLLECYSVELDQSFHKRLAVYYEHSVNEPQWNRLFHLYQAGQKQAFLEEATRTNFIKQILAFRPIEKVKQDIKLGINVALELLDFVVLYRFVLLLSELEYRENNFNPINFVREHLAIKNFDIAIRYMRDDHILQSSRQYALQISSDLYNYKLASEGAKLFTLGEPGEVRQDRIYADTRHDFWRTTKELDAWASSAALYYDFDKLLSVIEQAELIQHDDDQKYKIDDVKSRLLYYVAKTFVEQKQWARFERVLSKFDLDRDTDHYFALLLLIYAERIARENRIHDKEKEYYQKITENYSPESCDDWEKVKIATLVFQRTRNLGETSRWISDVEQPELVKTDQLDKYETLHEYEQRILLNTLLHLCGKGVAPSVAVPYTGKAYDNTMVDFERMLCAFTFFQAEVLTKRDGSMLVQRVRPFIEFFYTKRKPNDTSAYRITRLRKSFNATLVAAIGRLGVAALSEFRDYLLKEFKEKEDLWPVMIRVQILFDLIDKGLEKQLILPLIEKETQHIMDNADMAQRVENAQVMVTRYIDIGELDKVETWMHRAIEESLTISYSGDGQFYTWLDWLGRINMIQPEMAQDRTIYYLQRLNYIKDVSDNRQFYGISRKFLKTAFIWNYPAGIGILCFMLDNGLVYLEDALAELIRATIPHCKNHDEKLFAADLFGNLLIFLSDDLNSVLLRELLESFVIDNSPGCANIIKRLIDAISKNSLEDHRKKYFAEIVRAAENVGINVVDLGMSSGISAADDDERNRNTIRLKDGSQLEELDVLSRVSDLASLKDMLELEDGLNSHFNWRATIQKIAARLSKEQILELATLIGLNFRPSAILTELSDAALLIGETATSEYLAELAINNSVGSGWDKFYDGGTRLNAFKALRRVQPEMGKIKAFQAFSSDVLSADRPSSYAGLIDEILPLLTDNVEPEKIYLEIEQHVQRLLSNAVPDTNAAFELSDASENWRTSIYRALSFLSRFEAVPVKTECKIFIAQHFSFFDRDDVAKLAMGSDLQQEIFCDLLISNRHNEDLLRQFSPEIVALANSTNFIVQRSAKEIATQLHIDVSEEIGVRKNLSPIYNLSLEKVQRLKTMAHIDDDGNIVDTDDVSVLTNIVANEVAVIADLFGFEELNLHHRLYAIMKELAQPVIWSSIHEKKVRKKLDATGCDMSIFRPRVEVVRRALAYMLTELARAGLLIPKEYLDEFFFNDPAIYNLPITSRPSRIVSLAKEKYTGENWVDGVIDHSLLHTTLGVDDHGWPVIAEYYLQKKMEWGFPEEVVQLQLKARGAKNEYGHNVIFGNVMEATIFDYDTFDLHPDINLIVIVNENRSLINDRRFCWIAFNSSLALQMGWMPSPNDEFSWIDQNGGIVVRSTYWRNGNTQLGKKLTNGVTGEGWYVSISLQGLEQLKEAFPALELEIRIDRNFNYSGNVHKHTSITKDFE